MHSRIVGWRHLLGFTRAVMAGMSPGNRRDGPVGGSLGHRAGLQCAVAEAMRINTESIADSEGKIMLAGGALRAAILAVGVAFLAGSVAAQQDYPTKPIRLVVPYPPGGPTDLIARIVNDLLAERLRQPVIIDNRGGGATVIGSEIVARSPADGYTLLLATTTLLVVNPALNSKLPYDPERDFAPVSMLADQPYLLAVTASLPVVSVQQLVSHAKAHPGKRSFGSAGTGSAAYFAGEMFKSMAKVDIVHIPYKGTGPAITDLAGGHVALMFGGVSALLPLAQAGRLRALAVSTAKRSAGLPDIPTVAESGITGYEISSWSALVAPRGTPRFILERLNAEVNALLNRPEVRERFRQQGIDPEPGGPAQLTARIKSERARFAKLVAIIGLKAE